MKIIAITACPTGLAHTPMAAKALEQAALEMGIEIEVEQHRINGIKNKLEYAEIEQADFLIIAANKQLDDLQRFAGVVSFEVNLDDCIAYPKDVIESCMEQYQS
ncbi:MAG: PTS fructose transporter subunit IIB [Breznakia sp.]